MVGSGGGVRVAVPGYMEYIEYAELVIVVLISVAILTLMERQLMGVLQRRMGPSHVGYLGILQPIADGLKLVVKGNIVVMDSYNKLITIMSPVYSFTLSNSTYIWLLSTKLSHYLLILVRILLKEKDEGTITPSSQSFLIRSNNR